jgi:hypothetical protein
VSVDPTESLRLLSKFADGDLNETLARIEAKARGLTADRAAAFLNDRGAERAVLTAATDVKRLVGQINVTIHALGILLCLPHVLEDGECVEYLSLGAGNTGRPFDLETDRRVAEFKFINWRGGAESIRQNSVFKAFFMMAGSSTPKRKYLYLLGTEHALKFLGGGRSIESVLSRNEKVRVLFRARFGDRYTKVRDYYFAQRHMVAIEDVSGWLSELGEVVLAGDLGSEQSETELDPRFRTIG